VSTANDLMAAEIHRFYDAFGETVDIASNDGVTLYAGIKAILSFGVSDQYQYRGIEYRGSDAPGTSGEIRVQVSDVPAPSDGYVITRTTKSPAERWRVIGKGDLSEDELEWVMPISKYTGA
jgi:hypothetical protein